MAISPWPSGATLPVWAVTITDDTGAAVNLTNATITLLIRNVNNTSGVSGAGTWTITNATAGQATYSWAAADSANVGSYMLTVIITFSNGVIKTDPVLWQVVTT